MSECCTTNLPVLVFAPFGKDATLIERVLRPSAVNITAYTELELFGAAISEDAGAAIITEEVLQNGAIGALAQRLSAQPPWSDFPLIVLTGSGLSTASTESAVRSRAPLGNVTLLERPLRPVTLISAVRSALLARRRQYEVPRSPSRTGCRRGCASPGARRTRILGRTAHRCTATPLGQAAARSR